MTKTIFCIAVLALVIAIVFYAVFLAIRAKVNATKQEEGVAKGELKPFHFLLGGVFLCLLVLNYPVCYYAEFAENPPVLREIKTLFVTIYNTTATFFGDGDFAAVQIKDFGGIIRHSVRKFGQRQYARFIKIGDCKPERRFDTADPERSQVILHVFIVDMMRCVVGYDTVERTVF